MSTVVKVENISKRYKLGVINRRTLADELKYRWVKFRGKDPRDHLGKIGASRSQVDASEFWALKDVSFEVNQGDVVGFVGRNGAGKSTMLKILTRITEPTRGRAVIRGRVGSLLEVGTGFHPELTGRENIYMNGTILGMKNREIEAKFDEIVDFSGVEKFLDTPVKRYSSGMYVRLAFAVAANLESEVLLVDEVLAVGDAEFQKKCLGKMGEIARGGRTVLFVSHNMGAVQSLCSRCLLFEDGRIACDGETEDVVREYITVNLGVARVIPLSQRSDRRGSGMVRFSDGRVAFDAKRGGWTIFLSYESKETVLRNASVRVSIYSSSQEMISSLDSACMADCSSKIVGSGNVEVELSSGVQFSAGEYSINLGFCVDGVVTDHVEQAFVFAVADATPFDWRQNTTLNGFCHFEQKWVFGGK